MPKYTVGEVLDIIKDLNTEEKSELQQKLPDVLGNTANNSSVESRSQNQNIQGNNVGNRNIGTSFVQGQKQNNIAPSKTETKILNDLQEIFSILEQLKQDITKSNALNSIEKRSLEVPLETIEGELKKPNPDKSLVEESFDVLKKGLTGAASLAEPLTKLIPLVAKLWG
ncbi:MAG: hypothetical protein AAGG00_11030 [Cyanobacteria bacterium P01_H01_bin.150]